jgi:hypothetical protein
MAGGGGESVATHSQCGVDLVGQHHAAGVGVTFRGVEVIHHLRVADAVLEVDERERTAGSADGDSALVEQRSSSGELA